MKKGKKVSGGKYKKRRKKKSYEGEGQKKIVKIGERRSKFSRLRGGKKKIVLLREEVLNLSIKGKKKKVKIKNVLETPSNRFLARQNILTKGTIVETDEGKAKITNRPSQEGMINGILIE